MHFLKYALIISMDSTLEHTHTRTHTYTTPPHNTDLYIQIPELKQY